MLLNWGSLKSTVGGSPCLFEPLDYHTSVQRSLAPAHGEAGMFQRLGVAPRGAVTGNSHSFRHELMTAATRGGLSEDDMVQWFGRRDPRWAAYYDHTTNADFRDALAGVADILFGQQPEEAAEEDGGGT